MAMKKIVSFLLLRPAITKRNLSSLGLVGMFFAFYVLAGGKVTMMPKIERGEGFGAVAPANTEEAVTPDEGLTGDVEPREPEETEARMPRSAPVSPTTEITGDVVRSAPSATVFKTEEQKKADNLAEIEARLKNLKGK